MVLENMQSNEGTVAAVGPLVDKSHPIILPNYLESIDNMGFSLDKVGHFPCWKHNAEVGLSSDCQNNFTVPASPCIDFGSHEEGADRKSVV